jgi:preprotein translocase subunit SecD
MKWNIQKRTRIWLILIIFLAFFSILVIIPKQFNKVVARANNLLDQFKYIDQINLPSLREKDFSLGLDLQGGAQLIYRADVSQIAAGEEDDAVEGVRDVIERRVNYIGVSEAVVQTNQAGGEWRILIEIPGVTDVNTAIKLIGETPILEFKEEGGGLTAEEAQKLAEENNKQAKLGESIVTMLSEGKAFDELARQFSEDPGSKDKGGELGFATKGTYVPEFDKALFEDLKVGEFTKAPVKTLFGWHIIEKEEERGEGDAKEVRARHILIREKTPNDFFPDKKDWINTALSGKQLEKANVAFDPNTNLPNISLTFNDEGKNLFAEITGRNIGKRVGIFLDGEPLTAPTVQEKIEGGNAVITGNFTLLSARELSQRLNAGALPVPVELISQQKIGASLGQESLRMSLKAGMVGILLVMVFMLLCYRFPGFLSIIALFIYGLILLVLFKYIPITLTLAGIAGFILSLGMAVDANVLVFERLKEELAKDKPLIFAIEESFQRAWLSIRDGHISTLISCFILLWFSSSSVKGFAVTLSIGVIVNLFTALIVTRTLMRITSKGWLGNYLWLWNKKKVSHSSL